MKIQKKNKQREIQLRLNGKIKKSLWLDPCQQGDFHRGTEDTVMLESSAQHDVPY